MSDSRFRKEYLSRICAVQDYIESNLINSFSLEKLANVAGLSKYHFHRIFKNIVNENLFEYITRIRIEKIARFMIDNPERSLTDIAFKFGFTDSAIFSRSFRKRYGITASTYRKRNKSTSRMKNYGSKPFKIASDDTNDIGKDVTIKVMANVEIAVIDDMYILYAKQGEISDELGAGFQSTMHKPKNFALIRDLMNKPETKLLTIYYDNPEIIFDGNLRTSIGMVVAKDVKSDDELFNVVIPSGKYAIGHFKINASQYDEAWNYLYGEWLLDSGFQPGDGVSFEMHINDANTHPKKKHLVDIYLPIKPL